MNSQARYRTWSLVLVIIAVVAGGAWYLLRYGNTAIGTGSETISSATGDQQGMDLYRQLCAAKALAGEKKYAAALTAFEDIVQKSGDSSYRWDAEIQAALSMASLARFDDAIRRLERIIRDCPLEDENGFARLAKADVLGRAGQYDAATACFEEMVAARTADRPWLCEESLLGLVNLAERRGLRGLQRAIFARLIHDFPGMEDTRRFSAQIEREKLDEKMAAIQAPAIENWTGRKIDRLAPGQTLLKAGEGPFLVTGPIVVGASDAIRIEAGVRIRFTATAGLRIEGSLIAAGTPERPIELLPLEDEPGRDYWRGIEVNGSRASAELAGCRIAGADPGVSATGGRVKLEHCTLQQCGRATVVAERGAQVTMKDCTVTGAFRCGVECLTGAGIQISDSRFVDIATVGLSLFQASANSSITSTRLEKCRGDGIALRGKGAMVIEDSQVLHCGGCGLAALDQMGLTVSRSQFEGNSRAGISSKDHCEIILEDSRVASNKTEGMIAELRCNGEIRRNRFENNGASGLLLGLDCPMAVTLNSIVNNRGPGLLLRHSAPATLRLNEIAGNGEAGLRNEGVGKVNAAENWWGSANEAEVARSIQSQKDKPELGEVEYRPWLREPPAELKSIPATKPTGA